MFHVQLRQFPHATRAFNLSREELDSRILRAWAAGRAVELDERRWEPDRARLTIIEGPALAPEDIGLGRGWANAMRRGRDVTAEVLAQLERMPGLEELKRELLSTLDARGRLSLPRVVELAGERQLHSRPSERLALCEQAVWELLHQRRVKMFRGEQTLRPDQWQLVLLDWTTWTDDGPQGVWLKAAAPG
ncbi:MAG: hypothetical protein JOZ98_15885 [Solirubrobacterales bacterium]|nr:hypothetical protein [Solirubrobacterales bacterium]MBV9799193.1 hypothetical protein [Solirubrobacterales bacterium]